MPPGAGPHPGVVYVSGSGPTLREEAQWLESVFVSRGIAVLAYDKRGNGQSTGRYPGSLASDSTIRTLAGDAVAAARFLAAQSGIDRSRVGLYGLSQGGWIIPQAVGRAGGAVSWALIQSGPTVTQGESDTYANLVASGVSLAAAEAQARAAGPSGYDPRPWIEKLRIPVLWIYAGRDGAQPVQHSREILRGLSAGHDFAVEYYASAPHPLFDATGFPAGDVRNGARLARRARARRLGRFLLHLRRVRARAGGAVHLRAVEVGLLGRLDVRRLAAPGLERGRLERAAVGEAELPRVRAERVDRVQPRRRVLVGLAAGEEDDPRHRGRHVAAEAARA